jgi:hypothetical protein
LTAKLVVESEGQFAGVARVAVGGVDLGSVPHRLPEVYWVVVKTLTSVASATTCRLSATRGELARWLRIHKANLPHARTVRRSCLLWALVNSWL